MARIINLIIVILEIIAFTKAIRKRSLKELAVYYTQISNLYSDFCLSVCWP